ncbi:hypothetical protein BDBG_03559 [Blastomyces gilchristii SLH14081]|uniref:Uncharacterized protein n=1 Tax=Blastomyces gilchristii (strain SLH14081) TaxID=559298 RepID=A0A179UID0_BLAGS|nr:uncharacterized protein BDBG_03559 [Blastomyces gilchristii SLH14081]OAT07503.1 hypothetical protein BDBG_03559 [Blastomyces gilchristii SLH14081]
MSKSSFATNTVSKNIGARTGSNPMASHRQKDVGGMYVCMACAFGPLELLALLAVGYAEPPPPVLRVTSHRMSVMCFLRLLVCSRSKISHPSRSSINTSINTVGAKLFVIGG